MKNYLSKNKFGFLLFIFTIVLAVIVLFTALRLYQLKNSPITLVAPGESEASQDNILSCQLLVINFGASPSPSVSPTATPSTSSSASPSSTSSPTATPSTGSSASPTATPTASATSTPTTKPTSVATATPTVAPATLPVAGFSAPTIIGMVLAGVLLIGAFLLAI